ncbi:MULTISPECIES: hypothetical protein [Roseomonadaceae]|uniref:Collagen-like protein n=1 Tax=Falsiroseomonas oleicola TaxID=2801474 RepID=A0ABS6H4W6_9PROT|nr:hypothetical protein [Roseomonas oleicola]MBU8542546.1 hypothetical protein [Roseomonas oleicola]
MRIAALLPALAVTLSLGVAACDDTDSASAPTETRTGQSGATTPADSGTTGVTGSAGRSVPGASGTAPIGGTSPALAPAGDMPTGTDAMPQPGAGGGAARP